MGHSNASSARFCFLAWSSIHLNLTSIDFRAFLIIIITMSEEKTSGLLARVKQEMEDTYQFHEQGSPGRLLNHADLLFAVTVGKVNRYIVVPLVGVQSFRDGIADHMKEVVITGGAEATLFILFSAYFARIKKRQLLELISQE